MQVRYYSRSALLKGNRHDAEVVGSELGRAWHDGSFKDVVRRLSASYGEFDPAYHFFGPHGDCVSSKDYEAQIYSLVEDDLRESLRGGSAPVKSAYEVLRHVRDLMRTVIEFQGLTLESYLDFRDNIKTRVNRLVAGPPALRSKQLLALIDADVVTVPVGPLPAISPSGSNGFTLRSRRFEQPHLERVDWLIHGHIENPTICRSSSALLQRLFRQGRIKPLSYGGTDVGSIALSEDFPPDRRPGASCAAAVGLRLAHRGGAVLHPLRAVSEEPFAGLPRRPALHRGDPGLRPASGRRPQALYS